MCDFKFSEFGFLKLSKNAEELQNNSNWIRKLIKGYINDNFVDQKTWNTIVLNSNENYDIHDFKSVLHLIFIIEE